MAEQTKRLKFTSDITYKKVAYGPNCAESEADVDAFWAKQFLKQKCAVEVKPEPPAPTVPRDLPARKARTKK